VNHKAETFTLTGATTYLSDKTDATVNYTIQYEINLKILDPKFIKELFFYHYLIYMSYGCLLLATLVLSRF
jgi:hypothetical protein